MIAYKVMRQMKSGAIRSLFIDRVADRPIGKWLKAESHPTKGYELRFGWHCTLRPLAPHISLEKKVWVEVEIKGDYEIIERPLRQGGKWLLAKGEMKIIRIVPNEEINQINAEYTLHNK